MSKGRLVWFMFADWRGYSGQREASRLIYSSLDQRRWSSRILRMPALDRSGNRLISLMSFSWRLLWAWASCWRMTLKREAILHLSLGQTEAAFIRDGVPLWFAHGWRSRRRVIVSLHASNFMTWSAESRLARRFLHLLKYARVITVLGDSQRRRLVSFGVQETRVRIVPNTCEVSALEEPAVRIKHDADRPMRVLFLSSLIDTKGFPEFLEALCELSKRPGCDVEAVLCGPLTASQFNERFQSEGEARRWIEIIIARINDSSRVRARWIAGASGEAKWSLYREAHVFVLPTRYLVEAQPIVLLEAMAHGCAVITTTVGEIRTILSESEALFLEHGSADEVASGIERLISDPEERQRLAIAGLARFKREFALDRYVKRWESIFTEVAIKS